MAKTNILGTEYTVKMDDLNNAFLENKDGYCATYEKQIVIRKPDLLLTDSNSAEAKGIRMQETIIHELVHGYCRQSAVFYDDNENLVDWIAQMLPKIVHSYNDIVRQFKEEYK